MPEQVDQYLVGVSLPDSHRAQEFLTAATRLGVQGSLKLKDAVIVVKDDGGRTSVRETIDPQPGQSALSSGVWTSLLGLILGGPVGWLVGGAVGAGVGAAVNSDTVYVALLFSTDMGLKPRPPEGPANAVTAFESPAAAAPPPAAVDPMRLRGTVGAQ